ncbi:hypothetical protein Asppvi_006260 [Aspergillus pseudoviridinutans]|uniref:Uncharacterized protein n=1 Tax=Aspergillus pseudoviridinutans TaxID=1517512 RepID=A0A9P3ETH8_9EURO|nr:uncharacterized protein Asppvi_006260 [Aspergillus pseudoviridinutans]GIJ87354.1 hypothetical protein Asppvi_006260 [Aspergillus pseudoviridinutans]
MADHSTDAIDIHSDDERKPSLSALDTDEQASRRTVKINPIPEFGPKQPMPEHLVDILEEWHKQNGRKPPRCAYANNKGTYKWKVFDREGKELELSKFEILSPCAYSVLVLHSPDFPQKLVRSRWPHWTKHGSFLIAWQGVTKGFEAKCCAIRVFAPKPEKIAYSQDVWKVTIPDLDKEGEGIKKRPLPVATAPSQPRIRNRGQEREREKEPEMRKRVSRPKREVATSSSNSGDASESSDETDSSAEESSDASSSSEEDEEENVTVPIAKRRRLQQQTSTTLVRTRKATDPVKATNPAKVTFKLVSYRSGAIRAFPLDECKTGRDLFDKARTFFRLFDKNVDVKILSCQVSSERAQHFLFGSEGEFELLIKHAKDGKSTEDGTVTIEVNHVLEP